MAPTRNTTIYDTGTLVGAGRQNYVNLGFQYTVGPYRLRAIAGNMKLQRRQQYAML